MMAVSFKLTGNYYYNKDLNLWVSKCNETKMFTYGSSKEDAQVKMRNMIDLWRLGLSKQNMLTKRLTELSITYKVEDVSNSCFQRIAAEIDEIAEKRWNMELAGAVK